MSTNLYFQRPWQSQRLRVWITQTLPKPSLLSTELSLKVGHCNGFVPRVTYSPITRSRCCSMPGPKAWQSSIYWVQGSGRNGMTRTSMPNWQLHQVPVLMTCLPFLTMRTMSMLSLPSPLLHRCQPENPPLPPWLMNPMFSLCPLPLQCPLGNPPPQSLHTLLTNQIPPQRPKTMVAHQRSCAPLWTSLLLSTLE